MPSPYSPTLAGPTTRRRRLLSWLVDSDVGAVVAGAVLVVVLAVVFIQPQSRLDTVTVINPTGYELYVTVSGGEGHTALPIVVVRPGETREVHDVLDPGQHWRIVLRGQGRDAGVFDVTRADLQAAGWRIEVPASAGDALAAQGAPLSPR
jgi:hypothetical protein